MKQVVVVVAVIIIIVVVILLLVQKTLCAKKDGERHRVDGKATKRNWWMTSDETST